MGKLFDEARSLYQQYLDGHYKKVIAFQIMKTYRAIEEHLVKVGVVKSCLFELDKDKILASIVGLDRDKLFKNRYPEVAPYVIKANQSITGFVNSDPFNQFLKKINVDLDIPAMYSMPVRKIELEVNDPEAIDQGLFEKLTKAFDICTVYYDEYPVSNEPVIKSYLKYLCRTLSHASRTTDVVFHTGSFLFDVVNVAVAAVYCLVTNELTPQELLDTCEVGQVVLYKGDRHLYGGQIVNEMGQKCFKIKKDKANYSETKLVPKAKYLEPYYGDSMSLDRRGLRGVIWDNRLLFHEMVAGDVNTTAFVSDKSVVLVTPNSGVQTKELMNRIDLKINDTLVPVLDLVRASYFTEDNEILFAGNSGKLEPNLKFSNSVYLGRKKLLERSDNRNIGILVLGEEFFAKAENGLDDVIEHEKAQFALASATMSMSSKEAFLREHKDAHFYFCSRGYLEADPEFLEKKEDNPYTAELYGQMGAITGRVVTPVLIEDAIGKENVVEIRNMIVSIKKSSYDFESKDRFVQDAWTLLKLYSNAAFPIRILREKEFAAAHPFRYSSIGSLQGSALFFPEGIRAQALDVVRRLAEIEKMFFDGTPKQQMLEDLISKVPAGQSVCIIVPSVYQIDALERVPISRKAKNPERLYITMPERFDSSKYYDTVIAVGDFEGKYFSPYYCTASKDIKVFLYPDESSRFTKKEKEAKHSENIYLRHSYYKQPVAPDDVVEEEDAALAIAPAAQADVEREGEMDSFIRDLEVRRLTSPISSYAGSAGMQETKVAYVVSFDTGEKAYLTPYFKAYVFADDGDKMVVKETNVNDLKIGDEMVFTRSGSGNRDIVDDIMEYLVEKHLIPDGEIEAYRLSLLWKQSLIEYCQVNHIRPKDLAKMMKELGATVVEATIVSWMTPSNGTISPQKPESIQLIGKVTNNAKLIQDYREVFEACSNVKAVRRKILDKVSETMINRLNHKPEPESGDEAEIYRKINSSAEVYRISQKYAFNDMCPNSWVNKPI